MVEPEGPRPEVDRPGSSAHPDAAETPPAAVPKSTFRIVWHFVWRILIGIVGTVVILAGLGLSLPGIPGPGFLVVLAGLAILATEFSAPRRLLRYLREKVRRKKSEGDEKKD